jgi:sugar-specific transcriptional regulator TrmB
VETAEKIDELTKAGLSEDQAEVYVALLSRGRTTASKLRPFTSLSRPMLYRILDELIELDLVLKEDKPQMVSQFECAHPVKLREFIDQKRAEVAAREQALENVLTPLISDFTALSGKPGVQFLPGRDGVEKALADTLGASDPIYAYIDTEAIDTHVRDINARYVKERIARGVPKRILMIDSPLAREKARTADGELTDIRVIVGGPAPIVPAVIEIYGVKVTYITFKDGLYAATIIQDESIYTMHRYLFSRQWESARSFKNDPDSAAKGSST